METLFHAIRNRDQRYIHKYVALGNPINIRDERGSTPLHEAIFEGNTPALSLLLTNEAYVNILDRFGNTPLHLACMFNDLEAAKLLLKYGAEIDYTSEGRSWTPLMLAINESYIDMANWLMSKGANPNHVEPQQGWTPLLVACEQGLTDISLKLIHSGSYVHATLKAGDAKGRSAIHLLSYYGEVETIRVLLDQGVDINLMPSEGGLSALHWAVYNHHITLVQFLVERGAEIDLIAGGIYQDRTPLHYTVSSGYPELAEYLLRYGADPLLQDREGLSPVSLALRRYQASGLERDQELLTLLESHI